MPTRKKKAPLRHKLWLAVPILLLWWAFVHSNDVGMRGWQQASDFFNEDDWMGWIHPFGDAVNRVIPVGPFDSIEGCRDYAFSHLAREYQTWESARYFCGYNCESGDHEQREDACDILTK